jgi:hypothetical protein
MSGMSDSNCFSVWLDKRGGITNSLHQWASKPKLLKFKEILLLNSFLRGIRRFCSKPICDNSLVLLVWLIVLLIVLLCNLNISLMECSRFHKVTFTWSFGLKKATSITSCFHFKHCRMPRHLIMMARSILCC